ncbi:unnamed protein product, partial [Ilex paraguariensis]
VSPRFGVFKVNCSRVRLREHKTFGLGIVVRDCNGVFMAGLARKIELHTENQEMEATTMKEVIKIVLS